MWPLFGAVSGIISDIEVGCMFHDGSHFINFSVYWRMTNATLWWMSTDNPRKIFLMGVIQNLKDLSGTIDDNIMDIILLIQDVKDGTTRTQNLEPATWKRYWSTKICYSNQRLNPFLDSVHFNRQLTLGGSMYQGTCRPGHLLKYNHG